MCEGIQALTTNDADLARTVVVVDLSRERGSKDGAEREPYSEKGERHGEGDRCDDAPLPVCKRHTFAQNVSRGTLNTEPVHHT